MSGERRVVNHHVVGENAGVGGWEEGESAVGQRVEERLGWEEGKTFGDEKFANINHFLISRSNVEYIVLHYAVHDCRKYFIRYSLFLLITID